MAVPIFSTTFSLKISQVGVNARVRVTGAVWPGVIVIAPASTTREDVDGGGGGGGGGVVTRLIDASPDATPPPARARRILGLREPKRSLLTSSPYGAAGF
jgi:hypothetical protein